MVAWDIFVMLIVFFCLLFCTGVLYLIFSLARYFWRKGSDNS
nr:MAG TPA: Oxaloacetate decarboxylase, gamma chain [Microviridae sp.]